MKAKQILKPTAIAVIAALVLLLAGMAGAQQVTQLQPGVARVSLIHGDVSLQRGDSGDWVAVTLNTPVVAGDRVATGNDSRAELQLDWADMLRLSSNASAKVADLTRDRVQVQVGQGLTSYDILHGATAYAEIDTPNISIHPTEHGSYRVQVNSDSETEVIVRSGSAEITTPQGSTKVDGGQMITVEGTTNPQYQIASAPSRDDWDKFNRDRDGLIDNAEAWQHTDHYYTGAGDLDAYGAWRTVPGYGSVWVPAQGPNWVPYRDGRWVWEPYYGWTWVSYEPWGWAPFHYGRWFLVGSSWCWWPGPVVAYPAYYPVWAPAYVSFFGFHFGHGGGFFFGFGNVGWLPIGPGDGFFPWYGRRGRVVNVTNITNITNVTNITNIRNVTPEPALLARGASNLRLAQTNSRMLRAVSAVPAETFGKGGAQGHLQAVDAGVFRAGSRFTGTLPVVPTRASLRTVDRAAAPPLGAVQAGKRTFFTRNRPPAPKPFTAQVAQVRQRIDRSPKPMTARPNQVAGVGPKTTASSRKTFSANGRMTAPTNRGPESIATKGGNSAPKNLAPKEIAHNGAGWHRFGEGAPQPKGAATPPAPGASRGNERANPGRPVATASPSSRGEGWHSFSGGQRSSSKANLASANQGTPGRGASDRRNQPAPPREMGAPAGNGRDSTTRTQSGSEQGWHRFSPTSSRVQSEEGSGIPAGRPAASGRASRAPEGNSNSGANQRPGWHQFTPQSSDRAAGERATSSDYSRGQSGYDGARGDSAGQSRAPERPPLDLRQPIVTERASSPSGGYGSERASGYSQPRPEARGYSESHGGGYSSGGHTSSGYSGGSRGGSSSSGSHGSSGHDSGGRPH